MTACSLEWTCSFSITWRTCHSTVWGAMLRRSDIAVVSRPSASRCRMLSSRGGNSARGGRLEGAGAGGGSPGHRHVGLPLEDPGDGGREQRMILHYQDPNSAGS